MNFEWSYSYGLTANTGDIVWTSTPVYVNYGGDYSGVSYKETLKKLYDVGKWSDEARVDEQQRKSTRTQRMVKKICRKQTIRNLKSRRQTTVDSALT
jgi:hypothetical protein